VDIKKSEFNVTKIKFLGFIISTNRIAIDTNKLSTVNN